MKDSPLFSYFFSLCLIIFTFPMIAYAGEGTAYNRMVFFGDSLTDNGNLYNYDFGYLPKSPPYFQGRFTNGYVWSDKVAKHFYDNNLTAANNYALGGQTAVFHGPSDKYLPVSLTMAVNTYLWRTSWDDRVKTLYLIWIGANDYLRGVYNVDDATDEVINSIKYNIENLIYYGGMNFIVVNLPDLSKTPSGLQSDASEELSILTALHNHKLQEALEQIKETYKTVNIQLFNANYLFEQLLKNSGSDTMPNVHLTNITEGCWQGGYTYKMANKSKSLIHANLQEYIQTHPQLFNGSKANQFDADKFEAAVMSSPDLIETFTVMQAVEDGTQLPCHNPDEYAFWDKLHPSAIVHKMFAKRMIEFISANFTPAPASEIPSL